MLQNLKTVTKGSLVYGFGNMSIKLVGLVLIPIYTNEKYLSVYDFSIVGIVDITSQLIVSLLGFSLSQALIRWYWEIEYRDKQKSMFYSVFIFLVLACVLSMLIFTLFAGDISILLFDSDRFSTALKLMMGSASLQVLIALLQSLMKIQQKPGFYTITNIARLVLTLLLTIIFVVVQHKGINGIYEAQIYGSVLFFAITSGYIYRNIEFKLDYKILKEMLHFSYPLIFASTSGILISVLDKYILNYLATRTEVSVYIFAFKLANSLKLLIIASGQMAITPLIFQMMNVPDNKRFYSKSMTYFAFIVMIFVVLLSTFSYEVVHLFAQSNIYYEAYRVVPILSFAFFFGMLKDTASTGLQITKKTGIISGITIAIMLLNGGLNYLLIPYLSYFGAALSFLVSQILFFIFMYRFSQKEYPIPYELWKIVLIMIVGLFLCLLSLLLNDLHIVLRLLLKALNVIAFPLILYQLGFYEAIEIKRLKEAWIKWRNPLDWKRNLKKIKYDF
jgi:O-antigen/teichoic acid export membrane protein